MIFYATTHDPWPGGPGLVLVCPPCTQWSGSAPVVLIELNLFKSADCLLQWTTTLCAHHEVCGWSDTSSLQLCIYALWSRDLLASARRPGI